MATAHGTRTRYTQGCRCDDCRSAHAAYQRDYRERRADGGAAPVVASVGADRPQPGPGPVESGVEAEISGLAAEARPGLAQAALALARILDNPKAVNQQPAAAKVLATMLNQLHTAAARGRRGNLALVRSMTEKSK
jgi:hypothetical protein